MILIKTLYYTSVIVAVPPVEFAFLQFDVRGGELWPEPGVLLEGDNSTEK